MTSYDGQNCTSSFIQLRSYYLMTTELLVLTEHFDIHSYFGRLPDAIRCPAHVRSSIIFSDAINSQSTLFGHADPSVLQILHVGVIAMPGGGRGWVSLRVAVYGQCISEDDRWVWWSNLNHGRGNSFMTKGGSSKLFSSHSQRHCLHNFVAKVTLTELLNTKLRLRDPLLSKTLHIFCLIYDCGSKIISAWQR